MAVGSKTGKEELAHVYGMWVDPRARRSGVGRRLLDDVIAWTRSVGAKEIELGVTATNRGALTFYECMGFVDTKERRPLREGAFLEVIVMRRSLALASMTRFAPQERVRYDSLRPKRRGGSTWSARTS
jgi:ribosomal protein S18 acetylase RimI-like enzyme